MNARVSKRRGALPGVLAGAALLGFGAWIALREWPASPREPLAAAQATPPQAATAAGPSTTTRDENPAADGRAPLTSNTPVATLWTSLAADARAGDGAAACRLAVETLRCGFVMGGLLPPFPVQPSADGELATLLAIERDPGSLARPTAVDDAAAAALSTIQATHDAAQVHCDGLQAGWLAEAPALLRSGALAGIPDAQALYASGEGWFLTAPGALVGPTYEQWVVEAPLLVTRMLEAGHPDAPGLLAGAYAGQTWLSGLYPRDDELAATYRLLNARLMRSADAEARALRDVPATLVASARQRAASLYQRHYAGQDAGRAGYWLGAGTRIVSDAFGARSDAPAPCGVPARPAGTDATTTDSP